MAERPRKPGWYNDPEGVHEHQAYWDGEQWTGRTRKHKPWEWVAVAVLAAVLLVILGIVGVLILLTWGGLSY